MAILITNEKLNEILIEVGIPILDITDLPYTETQIKDSFIYPAMREYFKFFPIEEQLEYTIGNAFEIDFPDSETFSIVDARLITNVGSSGYTADPFVNAINIRSVGQNNGRYGTPYDYGLARTYYTDRANMQANINSQNAFKLKVDKNNRKLVGFSNVQGRIAVTWAKLSLDYDDIAIDREQEVKMLAGANLLQGWGGLIKMQSSDNQNDLDGDYFIDRAKELKDEVMEKFKKYSKIVILRG